MKNKLQVRIIIFFLPLLLLSSCGGTKRIVPLSGREYKVNERLFSDAQMLATSQRYYPMYVQQLGGDSKDKAATEMVNRVSTRLIGAAERFMKEHGYGNERGYYDWEVHLVPAPGMVNATCMAGGKILVFEGLLNLVNEAGLAAILGHEIGHAIGHHMAEQKTKEARKQGWQAIGALGVGIAGIATKADTQVLTETINMGVGLSNQVMEFFEMKFSREQENEADYMGVMLMAMAGYDPQEAPKVWEKMLALGGEMGGGLLDDHPANSTRINNIRNKWMDEALAYYNGGGSVTKPSSPNDYYLAQNKSTSSSSSSSKPSVHPQAQAAIKSNALASSKAKTTPASTSKPVANAQKTAASSSAKSSATGSGKNYVVKLTKANIHSLPSKSSSVMGTLTKGKSVTVKNIVNGWASITYNNKTCYVEESALSAQ